MVRTIILYPGEELVCFEEFSEAYQEPRTERKIYIPAYKCEKISEEEFDYESIEKYLVINHDGVVIVAVNYYNSNGVAIEERFPSFAPTIRQTVSIKQVDLKDVDISEMRCQIEDYEEEDIEKDEWNEEREREKIERIIKDYKEGYVKEIKIHKKDNAIEFIELDFLGMENDPNAWSPQYFELEHLSIEEIIEKFKKENINFEFIE